ncbi:hypothetical protein EBZ39_13175, partial [bacterium]|nr:hypothetical protein [bacterium]
MGAKVLQFRPKGRRFRDLTIVGEGPEDVRKIEDQKAMSQASRDAHEAASKLAPCTPTHRSSRGPREAA